MPLNSSSTLIRAIGNYLAGIKHYNKMLSDYPVADCLPALQLRIEYQQQEAVKALAELATVLKENK